MLKLIEKPVCFRDEIVQGEEIREFVGRISSETEELSIALLAFPEGWAEPPQRPEFDEYSVVLEGALYVDTETVGTVIVRPGQGILTRRGERIRYRTPDPGGASYLSVCLPAFALERAHREPEGATLVPETVPGADETDRIVFCANPTVLQGTGMNSRQIKEFFGRFVGNASEVSIAKTLSFEGTMSDFRQTDDDQYVLVLTGELLVNSKPDGQWSVRENQLIMAKQRDWFQYLTPKPGDTRYFLICRPARAVDAGSFVDPSECEDFYTP